MAKGIDYYQAVKLLRLVHQGFADEKEMRQHVFEQLQLRHPGSTGITMFTAAIEAAQQRRLTCTK